MSNFYLTSQITSLTNGVIQELNNPNKHTIREYEKILKNPIAAACCQLKALRATVSLGEYQNDNKEIEDFILENIENMNGSLSDITGRLTMAMPFGFSCGEIAFKPKKTFKKVKYVLDGVNILDPGRVQFAGHYGKITHVRYCDGIRDVWIPYTKCIHITNGLVNNYNSKTAYGIPECEVAYPYVKLYSVIMSEMAVSAKTLATGILVGLADSDHTVYLYDQYGKPKLGTNGQPITLNAVQHLAEQLKGLENHSHIVTDKKNSVTAINNNGGEQFWNLALNILKEQIMLSFQTPQMVFSEGSGAMGVASLSVKHLNILDSTVEAIVKRIRDQLLEKIIKPLIVLNFGAQKNYGKFAVTVTSDPQQESMITQNLITAFSMGLVNPKTDIAAINVLRDKLKLSPLTIEEQFQTNNLAKLLEQESTPQQQSAEQNPEESYP